MQTHRTIRIRQMALSPEEFLRAGAKRVDEQYGWPGTFWDREMIDDSHPIARAPIPRPSAEQFAADLEALAGTDTPQREYPGEFFTRDVIYGDRD